MGNSGDLRVLGVVASPDRRGRTQELVRQALAGAAERGAETETIFLAHYSLPLCLDCRPWTCRTTRRCKQDAEGHFAFIAERFLMFWLFAAGIRTFETPLVGLEPGA